MDKFFKVCAIVAVALWCSIIFINCVGTFHADNVDWEVQKNVCEEN